MLAVLSIWDRTHPPAAPVAETTTQTTAGETLQAAVGTGGEPEENVNPTEAEEAESPTATEPPGETERTELEYQVQPGDTLGGIATRFEVDLAELMEVNELTDPDRLEVGQTLVIPGEEADPPTETPPPAEDTEPVEATDTPLPPTDTPPVPAGEAKVLIDRVVGAGDLDAERVLLKRAGSGELSLAGWTLEEEGGQVFTFPQLILFEDGAVNLYTRAGQATVVDLYWGLEAPVWESGEMVVVKDNRGEVQATYEVP
jgi:LysM repeat protein